MAGAFLSLLFDFRRVTAEAFQSLVCWFDKYGFSIELMAYPDIYIYIYIYIYIPEGSSL